MQKILFFFMAFVLLAVQPAVAAKPVSAEGAAEIKKIIDERLAFDLSLSAATGEGLVTGATTVTPKDSYYEARIPDISVKYSEFGTFNVGTVILNVTHGATDDEYLASMALPTTMSFTATDGSTAQLNIGKQKFAMAWLAPIKNFTRLDAEYGDITMTASGADAFAVTLSKMRAIVNLKDNGNGTWSGPSDIELYGAKVILPASHRNGETQITIDNVMAKGSYDSIDLKRAMDIEDKMKKSFSDLNDPKPEDISALVDSMMHDGISFFNGMTSAFDMNGINLSIQPLPAAEGRPAQVLKTAQMKRLHSFLDMQGLLKEKGTASMKMGLEGLTMQNIADADTMGYIPQEANVEVYLSDLPMQSLYKTVAGLIKDTVNASTAAEAAAKTGKPNAVASQHQSQVMAAMMAIPQMLSGAGSTLDIRNTYTKSADLNSKLDGSFKATAGATKIAVGSLTLTLQGLDELIVKLQSNPNPMAKQAVGPLSIMQMMGQQGMVDGKSNRTYKLDVQADGKVLMNGNDVAQMGGMLR